MMPFYFAIRSKLAWQHSDRRAEGNMHVHAHGLVLKLFFRQERNAHTTKATVTVELSTHSWACLLG